jgi:hypothetical protein
MFIKALKATWDECYKSEQVIDPTIEAVTQYLVEQFRVVSIAELDIRVEKIVGIVGKPVWPTFKWATHFVAVDGKVMAYTDGPVTEPMKIGPKTIEELYREHLIRIEAGRKEEQSAWQFARAVGEILKVQVSGESANAVIFDPSQYGPLSAEQQVSRATRKPRLTIDGKEIPFESITITTMVESSENL